MSTFFVLGIVSWLFFLAGCASPQSTTTPQNTLVNRSKAEKVAPQNQSNMRSLSRTCQKDVTALFGAPPSDPRGSCLCLEDFVRFTAQWNPKIEPAVSASLNPARLKLLKPMREEKNMNTAMELAGSHFPALATLLVGTKMCLGDVVAASVAKSNISKRKNSVLSLQPLPEKIPWSGFEPHKPTRGNLDFLNSHLDSCASAFVSLGSAAEAQGDGKAKTDEGLKAFAKIIFMSYPCLPIVLAGRLTREDRTLLEKKAGKLREIAFAPRVEGEAVLFSESAKIPQNAQGKPSEIIC